MGRLYFRIYLAVLGSLAIFAVLTGVTWRLFADLDRFGPKPEFFQAAAEQLSPPAGSPPNVQNEILARWRELSGYDLAIFGRDGQVIADASDGSLSAPVKRGDRNGPGRWRGNAWAHVVPFTDGRWLVAARPYVERSELRRFGWLAALAAITMAVGICAYPVVRRLTRRLEELQTSVAALGSGNLSARVAVVGKDEIARLAETFNRAADRIETLMTANRSLLANASHELRSPLARLRMGVEALPPSENDAGRNELSRNIKELDQLIEEILLASRLDAQSTDSTTFEPVDIVALVAEESARTNVELSVESEGLPIVSGDLRLLRRLFRNLLENAQRHGGQAGVEVIIRGQTSKVQIDVCDRGPGVPVAERERIFDPFYRLPGSRESDGSVGLGLSLVRQIVERHRGTVLCMPREGGGSCFRTELPASRHA